PRECFDDFVSETNIATAITRLSAFRDLSDDSMRLTSEASDCLLRVARIYAEAFDLFGVSSDVASWMQTESQTLGDETPLELLDTSVGFELVFHELKRLQYGIAG
ncbi:MAG: antitoxin Xre/MbcA/ParS toxin-binding domain-containing protein, partial [Planctomycetota bacterium]